MTTLSFSTLKFTALLLLSGGLAAAQSVFTLTVDGQDCGVQQWSFGVTADPTMTTGMAAKPSQLSNLLLTRAVDSCSAQFFKSSVTGSRASKVVLRQMDPATKVVSLSIELDTVPVATYQLAGQTSGGPAETVALAFERIQISYYTLKPGGSAQGAVTVGWDVARNQFF
jgi:type VI protein secretion system component Hcp